MKKQSCDKVLVIKNKHHEDHVYNHVDILIKMSVAKQYFSTSLSGKLPVFQHKEHVPCMHYLLSHIIYSHK